MREPRRGRADGAPGLFSAGMILAHGTNLARCKKMKKDAKEK